MPDPSPLPPLDAEEYRALRATIRERGSVRVIVSVITFVAWSALAIAVLAFAPAVAGALVSLVVLAAGFEAVFALHVGVERIGRYIQVRCEPAAGAGPAWERWAMALGREPAAATGSDPLFGRLFLAALLVNAALPLASAASPRQPLSAAALVVVWIVHLLVVLRIRRGQQFAARQRASDLELYRRLAAPAE